MCVQWANTFQDMAPSRLGSNPRAAKGAACRNPHPPYGHAKCYPTATYKAKPFTAPSPTPKYTSRLSLPRPQEECEMFNSSGGKWGRLDPHLKPPLLQPECKTRANTQNRDVYYTAVCHSKKHATRCLPTGDLFNNQEHLQALGY